jgi:hypothetical protein
VRLPTFFFPIYFVQGNELSAYISIHCGRNCAEPVNSSHYWKIPPRLKGALGITGKVECNVSVKQNKKGSKWPGVRAGLTATLARSPPITLSIMVRSDFGFRTFFITVRRHQRRRIRTLAGWEGRSLIVGPKMLVRLRGPAWYVTVVYPSRDPNLVY